VGLVQISNGLVYRRPATRGGRATDHLTDECGEVTGSAPVAIEHEGALIAAECPFGQAQLGFHHAPEQLGYHLPAMCTRTPDQPVLYST
jgi:hypothetical protein